MKIKLGINPYKVNIDEQDIISTFQLAFEGETMHTKYRVKDKKLDLTFSKHDFVVENDEYDHVVRDLHYEKERKELIEDHRYTVISPNLDAPDFNIYKLIN